jgi:hypothetical protein
MATTKKTSKKAECGEKSKKAFTAGMMVGQRMNKPSTKKKK